MILLIKEIEKIMPQQFTEKQKLGILTSTPTPAELDLQVYKDFLSGTQGVILNAKQQKYLTVNLADNPPDSYFNILEAVVGILLNRWGIKPDGQGIAPFNEKSQDYADAATGWWIDGKLDSLQADLEELILRDGVGWLGVEMTLDGVMKFVALPNFNGDWSVQSIRPYIVEKSGDWVQFLGHNWQANTYDEDGKTEAGDVVTRLDVWAKNDIGDGLALFRYKITEGDKDSPDSWVLLTPEEIEAETGQTQTNAQPVPIKTLPFIRFTTTDEVSAIRDVLTLQRLINHSVGDIDIAAFYHAFPAFSGDGIQEKQPDETLTYQQNTLFNGKDIKRIEGANLELMWDGTVLKYIRLVSMVTQIPLWFFDPTDITVPSGIALQVAESGLVQRINNLQTSATPQWLRAFDVARQWHNSGTGTKIDEAAQIMITWKPAETVNVIEDMSILVDTFKKMGLPDEWIWSDVGGLTTDQVKTIKKQKKTDPDSVEKIVTILTQLVNMGVGVDGWIKLLSGEEVKVEELVEVDVNEVRNGQ